jgi:tetratricopeptide (TPR) repeat protein
VSVRVRESLAAGLLIVASVLLRPALGSAQLTGEALGEVSFETSCAAGVRDDFNRAVALLHSFEFNRSREVFAEITRTDPSCAMAYWGVAMTYYHLLWAPPAEREFAMGEAAAQQAMGMPATERERGFIRAIATYYRDRDRDRLDDATRARAYEEAMADVSARNPGDREAELFYLVSTLSTMDPTDKTYEVERRTGARLEELAREMPNHPGVLHYLIHSYDYPPLAGWALQAADRYLEVAPGAAHALHMSSHIYTQEGMWEESVHANLLSVEASGGLAAPGSIHAADYLMYAYLQRGRDDRARDIQSRVAGADLNWGNGGAAFNAGAVAARYTLERHAWEDAASLPPLPDVAWSGGFQGQVAAALRYWARAVGAARSGQVESAEQDVQRLEDMTDQLIDHPNVWTRNTSRVLRLEAAAWLDVARGDGEGALDRMRQAAALEDETDKSSLGPGRVLPVHEQLGDLLLELGRPEEALSEYEASLQHAGHRFNSLHGAARAASMAGEADVARDYYRRLLDTADPESDRAELDEARTF